MIRALTYDKLRPYILPVLIGLLAFFAGEGIFKVMAERSLGSIVRHNVGTIAVLAIIFLVCNEGIIPAIFDLKKTGLPSIRQAAPLALFAVVAGITVSVYGGLDIIYGGIIFFIVLCLGLSVFFIFSEKPFHAFCLFWCMYPFLYFIQTQGGSIGFERPVIFDDLVVPFSSVYILILFCASILANLKEKALFKNANLRLIYWFVLLAIPSIFFSQNPMKSLAYFSFDIIVPLMFFIFALSAIKTRQQIESVVKFILLSLLVISSITIYFYMKSGQAEGVLDLSGAEGVMIPFATLASFAAVMFPLFFMFYKITRNKIYPFLLFAFAMLVVLSDNRNSLLVLLFSCLLLFLFSKIAVSKKVFIVSVGLVCLLFLLFLSHTLGVGVEIRHRLFLTILQLREGVDINEISSGRWEIWESAIRMIKDHPVMGIGAGMWQDNAFLYQSREYMTNLPGRGYSFYSSVDAHNFFLDLYLKYGILPAILFLYCLLNMLKKCSVAYKKETDSNAKRLIMAGCISLLVWIVLAIFEYRFYIYFLGTVLPGVFFWILVVFLLKSIEIQAKQKEAA